MAPDTPLSIKTASSLTRAGLGPRTDASHNRQISWMRRGGLGEIPTPDRPSPAQLLSLGYAAYATAAESFFLQCSAAVAAVGQRRRASSLCCETSLLAYAHQSGQPGFWQLHEAYGPLGRCEAARTVGIPCFRHGPPAPEHITMGSDPGRTPMIT
ncbi:hypothetical protein MKX07_006788 [Trichoderma sp. CBMAI-0711]|nr:hypothetical protein MKX07_006788 [Trichoderma sp. CBMAI-0711]